MAQVSFGTVLREARERKGYDVQSAARRLRIRPDILRAIENNDFSRLPARGYTRNMVNAYARLVGLNPSDITRMYLDEAYAYQVGRTRGESESPAHVSGRRSVSHHEARQASARQREGQRAGREGRDGTPSRRSDRTQGGTTRRSRSNASTHEYHEPLASRAARAESENRRGGRVGGAVTTQFTNFYSGSQNMGRNGNQTRLPYVIVAAVILVLLVVIIALLFGNKGASNSQDVAKVPITGVTDTSADGSGTSESASNDTSQQTQSAETAPTSVTVQYKLASGQTAYVVITQDGQATEEMLTGPVDKTVDVSGTWSLASWVSSGFTVTMDGKAVDFVNDATTGMPTATVNFKDYLAQWAQDHPNVKVDGLTNNSSSNGTSTTGSTSATTNGTSTGGTASTSTSTSGTSSTYSGTGTSTQSQSATGVGTAVNATGTANSTGSTGANTSSNTGTGTSTTYQ